jgi:O-antigen/teichoic acid export membrane protein
MIGAWFNGLAFIPFAQLQGQGRPDLPAKFHLLELFPFLLLLWVFVNQFGLLGAAIAWSLRNASDAAFLFTATRFHLSGLKTLVPPLCMIGAAYIFGALFTLPLVPTFCFSIVIASVAAFSALVFDLRIQSIVMKLLYSTKWRTK